MPRRTTHLPEGTARNHKNHSFELLTATWLMQAGWQVFTPLLDDSHCTDLLVSDGPNYFRIQIKTIECQDESCLVANRWKKIAIDYVVFFAKNSNWGYICPAFSVKEKPLNHADHKRFQQTRRDFLAAFHSL